MIPEDELYDMYCVQGMSTIEIAKEIGVVSSTILNWMKSYGIETRTFSESRLNEIFLPSKEELCDMYLVHEMSQPEIAKKIGVSQSTIHRYMVRCDIKIRTVSEACLDRISIPPKEKLHDMYLVQRMSQSEIAEGFGVSKSTVVNWMQKYKIKPRIRIGENSPNWHGGISFEPYCYKFDNKFKEAVRERDDFICQLCGNKQEFENKKLSVHHIHYDKANCYPDVVSLCISCHSKVNGNREYWEEYFENQLLERGLYCWSIT